MRCGDYGQIAAERFFNLFVEMVTADVRDCARGLNKHLDLVAHTHDNGKAEWHQYEVGLRGRQLDSSGVYRSLLGQDGHDRQHVGSWADVD